MSGFLNTDKDLRVTAEQLALIELFDKARVQSNALDGYFAQQTSCYGHAYNGLIRALVSAWCTNQVWFWEDAQRVAEELYERIILDSGESVKYALAYAICYGDFGYGTWPSDADMSRIYLPAKEGN